MAIYTVHLPPEATTADLVAERAVFVKDGFSLFGFAFGGLWLLAQRLWLPAMLYAALFGLVALAFWRLGLPRPAFGGVTALMALLVGLEGNEWIRRRLDRLGWTHAGTVSGPTLDECERRFFQDWTAEMATRSAPAGAGNAGAVRPREAAVSPASPGVLGVFPTARSRP